MDYEPATWRLIVSPAAPGAWNMAVDEAILEAVGREEALPTLRLYRWEPACLSLGYAQGVGDVDEEHLARLAWHLVRRPTGGRAILHADELTYAVMAPLSEPRVHGNVLESYRRLAEALLKSLQLLGLDARADGQYPLPANSSPKGAVCFEVPSNYEITAGGKKLIGSAQARRKEGVLQHGSLPLTGDLSRIVQALIFADPAARAEAAARLLDRATTVEAASGKLISWGTAAQALIDGFGQTLRLELRREELTSRECSRAAELVETKYDHPSWTRRI